MASCRAAIWAKPKYARPGRYGLRPYAPPECLGADVCRELNSLSRADLRWISLRFWTAILPCYFPCILSLGQVQP